MMGFIIIRRRNGSIDEVDVQTAAEHKLSVSRQPATAVDIGDVEIAVDSIGSALALIIAKLHDNGILSNGDVADLLGERRAKD